MKKICHRALCLLITILCPPPAVQAAPFSWISTLLVGGGFIFNQKSSQTCFTNRTELKAAVDDYLAHGENADALVTYGDPIGSWCVGAVTDMSRLFEDAEMFILKFSKKIRCKKV